MYSRRIVGNRIERAAIPLGFAPEYHSPVEVDEWNSQFEKRHADAFAAAKAAAQSSDPSRAQKIIRQTLNKLICNPAMSRLTAEEARWMRNERALVMCDAEYFLTRYYWILNVANELQHFDFESRPAQRILFDCMARLEDLRVAIEILLAKARQLGLSTLVQGLLLQKILFSQGVNSVAASADESKTREMVRKLLGAYDKLPFWMAPIYTRRVESDQGFLYLPGDGGITFQHGQQTNPIAMGSTLIGYHVSEVSSYPNARDTIEVGLFKAVHPNPKVLGVLESTCKGDTGWWHDTYWDAKTKWPRGAYRLMALFLPFYTARGMYPNETELRAHPVPEGWNPDHDTRKMIAESEAYVASNEVLATVLSIGGGAWEMPREQAWFWEWNFQAAKARGIEKDWFGEMPHTDQVAFQSSYESVFGKEVIAEVNSARVQQSDYDVFAIVGQSIEARQEPDPDEVDSSLPRIPITYRNLRGTSYRWEAVPLLWQEPFQALSELRADESHMGKLFVFHHPEPGYDYSIGVRTASGLGDDPTVISVCRRSRSDQEQDIQAAEFRDIGVSHVEAFAWAMAISAYYGKFMKPEHGMPRHREPYVAIEQQQSFGDTCQFQMGRMGYRRFHKPKRFDVAPKYMAGQDSSRRGMYTSGWAAAMLTDGFIAIVRNGWYKVNSPWTIWEMDHWEMRTTQAGKEQYLPSENATAHGLHANALAAWCPNDLRPMAERTAKRFMEVAGESKHPTLDTSPIQPGIAVSMITPAVSHKQARLLTLLDG